MKYYQEYFNNKLDEYGIKSPTDLKTDEEKKEFFNDVDSGWKSEDEKKSSNECECEGNCGEKCACKLSEEENEKVNLAKKLIQLASMISEDVDDEESIVAVDTFKCPECGTKVLEQTGYCVKCKKKVKKAKALLAKVNWKRYDIDSDRYLGKHIDRIKKNFSDLRGELSSYIFDESEPDNVLKVVKELSNNAVFLRDTFDSIIDSMVDIVKAVNEEEKEREKELVK